MPKTEVIERPYETMFICPVETSPADLDAIVEKLKDNLKEAKATVQGVQVWGRRRLAYPIKRNREGIYVYLEFSGDSEAADKLNGLMRVMDRIIRYMTVQKEVTAIHPPRKYSGSGPDSGRGPGADDSSDTSPQTKEAPSPK